MRGWGWAVVAVLLSGAPGCGSSKVCTLRGCVDMFQIAIAVSAKAPGGAQTVTVTADNNVMTCTFASPGAPGDGGFAPVQCATGVTLELVGGAACMVQTDAAFMQSCTASYGAYSEIITVAGAPTSVRVQQSADGMTVLDQMMTPSYDTLQPNGPACPPTCHQAVANWTIPTGA
jgi:hypothetical protein